MFPPQRVIILLTNASNKIAQCFYKFARSPKDIILQFTETSKVRCIDM
jgi:hypothetical protein